MVLVSAFPADTAYNQTRRPLRRKTPTAGDWAAGHPASDPLPLHKLPEMKLHPPDRLPDRTNGSLRHDRQCRVPSHSSEPATGCHRVVQRPFPLKAADDPFGLRSVRAVTDALCWPADKIGSDRSETSPAHLPPPRPFHRTAGSGTGSVLIARRRVLC